MSNLNSNLEHLASVRELEHQLTDEKFLGVRAEKTRQDVFSNILEIILPGYLQYSVVESTYTNEKPHNAHFVFVLCC